jgi:hypothetical protein
MSTPLRQLASLAGIVVGALAITPAAHATTLDFLGFKNGSVATTIQAPVHVGTQAGEFLFKDLSTNKVFSAFCIEIDQYINDPDHNYSATPIASDAGLNATKRSNLDKLFTAYYGTLGTSTTNSAAFQLAVWEIVNDPTPANVTTGTFRVSSSSAAIAQANTWVQSLSSLTQTGGWQLTVWRSRTSQDQISASRVPEPASAALLLLGLGMLGAARRRNRAA